MPFKPATREQNRLRLCIDGPSGCGKTFSAIRFAHALAGNGGRIAVIDSEHGSARKYVGTNIDGIQWQFDHQDLEYFSPANYEQAIREAGREGYDVLIIDSLSHAWMGVGGALDQIDRSQTRNSFAAWKDVTPQHVSLVESMLRCPCHLIVTLRSKMEYVLEPNEKGQMVPKKVGMKPIQKDGIEYEFDIVGDMDLSHTLRVSKTHCPDVDGKTFPNPGPDFITIVREWLFSGSSYVAPAPYVPPAPPPATTTQSPGAARNGSQNGGTSGGANGGSGGGGVRRMNAKESPANDTQIEIITRLADRLGLVEKINGMLAARGASSLKELPFSEAEQLVIKLEAKDTEAQAKEAF